MKRQAFWIGVGVLFLSSCHLDQPLGLGDLSQVSGDIPSVVLRYDPQTKDMVPEDAVLTNVLNLESLKGANFDIFYRSSVWGVEQTSQGSLVWDMGYTSPEGLNFQKSGEQYVPTDYETFLFTTLYHHFESAFTGYRNLFQGAQVSCPACFRHMDVQIEPQDAQIQPQGEVSDLLATTDNAAYIRTSDMFLIPEQFYGSWVHLGMNESVIAHEVFHALFEVLVEKNYPSVFIVEQTRPTLESFLVFGLLHEGLADYFSFVITGNDNILYHSFGNLIPTTGKRRLDRDRQLPTNLFSFLRACGKASVHDVMNAKESKDCKTFQQEQALPENGDLPVLKYVMGTVVARSLVRAGQDLKDPIRVSHGVIQFLANFHQVFPKETDIQLSRVLTEMIRHQAVEDQPIICKVFLEDYDEIASDIRTVSGCQ